MGNALLTAGLVWIALYRALVSMYPRSWGGPNIGAGFITLLSYGSIAVGLGLTIGVLIETRRGRRGPTSSGRRIHRRGSRVSWWLPPGISGAAAVACVVLILAPPGVIGSDQGGAAVLTSPVG